MVTGKKPSHKPGSAGESIAKKSTSTAPKSAKETSEKAMITKDMTLGELVTKHPEAAPVLIKNGFHCIGCHMAAHETIEQGAAAHGMDAKAIDRMVKEMNDAVANK